MAQSSNMQCRLHLWANGTPHSPAVQSINVPTKPHRRWWTVTDRSLRDRTPVSHSLHALPSPSPTNPPPSASCFCGHPAPAPRFPRTRPGDLLSSTPKGTDNCRAVLTRPAVGSHRTSSNRHHFGAGARSATLQPPLLALQSPSVALPHPRLCVCTSYAPETDQRLMAGRMRLNPIRTPKPPPPPPPPPKFTAMLLIPAPCHMPYPSHPRPAQALPPNSLARGASQVWALADRVPVDASRCVPSTILRLSRAYLPHVCTAGAAARRAHAGHLFGPLLTPSRNLGFLCGPFPVEDMGNAPFHKFFVHYPYFFLPSYAFWMWHI